MQPSTNPSQQKKPRREHVDDSTRAIQYVNNNRGRALTEGERLDILSLHANLRADKSAILRKESVTNKISRLLGRSNKTVGKVWSDFITHSSVIVSDVPGNRNERITRIPRSVRMQSAVQTFIRTRCETRVRTTSKDVMHFLVEAQYMHVEMTDPVQVKTTLRKVQQFVKEAGYCRGERKSPVLRLSPQNDLKRAEYVQIMTEDKNMARRIVYMDESYIHQHYTRHADSLYNPSDLNSVKSKHKGRRVCFITAIIDQDRSVESENLAPHQQAGLLLETVDIFEGGKQTKDYHGMFCHDYFVKWMEALLRCLKNKSISNCLIVMDNAKYHKVLPATTPKRGSKKEVLFNACQQYGIAVPSNATKPILWELLSKHINKSIVPVVVEMARAERHDVVYTPPHHSNLQPIEIVRAIVKGDVGRQYTTCTTFADILTRLDDAFRRLQPSTVQGCIDTAKKQLLELKKHLEAMDAQNESSGDDAECDSDSGGSDGGSDLD